ncbi:MAG: hypothetical protein R3B99_09435 [Polyangiales bacterium]
MRRFAAWAMGGMLLACGGGAETRETTSGERVEIPGESATSYATAPTSGGVLGSVGTEEVRRGVERAAADAGNPLVPDGRLAELASWIGGQLGPGGAPPPHPVIELFTRSLGLVEPAPHLAVLGVPDVSALEAGVADAVRGFLARQPYGAWGAAVVERGGLNVAVLVLSTRALDLEPVARRHEVGARVALRGRLHDGFRTPQLALAPPNGEVRRLPLGPGPEFTTDLTLTSAGAWRVEVLAQGSRGDTVVANFRSTSEDPPRFVEMRGDDGPTTTTTRPRASSALFRRLNDARAREGVPPSVAHPPRGGLARAQPRHGRAPLRGHTADHG